MFLAPGLGPGPRVCVHGFVDELHEVYEGSAATLCSRKPAGSYFDSNIELILQSMFA
jgi:hypothetical protein